MEINSGEDRCTTLIAHSVGYGQFGGGEFEFSAGQGVFNENEQMELAAELLEVSSEAEMDQFLGDLISKAGKAIGKFVSSPTGQAIGGVLKGAAKQLLPVAGQALGGFLGGSTGSQLGGQLGSAASDMFEAEAEEREVGSGELLREVGRRCGEARHGSRRRESGNGGATGCGTGGANSRTGTDGSRPERARAQRAWNGWRGIRGEDRPLDPPPQPNRPDRSVMPPCR